jgi:hypothetical protein
MKLLVEQIEDTQNLIESLEGGEKQYYIEGPCIQADVQNRNGRIYEKSIIKPEVDRFIREEMQKNRAVGELNHPAEDPRINYERATHRFIELREEGSNWIGKAIVQKRGLGSTITGLMDIGVQMGISSRALGSVKKRSNVMYVQNDFRLITPGDIVSDPSAPDAYLTNLMENKEWVWGENGELMERASEIKDLVNNQAKAKQLNEEGMSRLFQYILSKI